MIANMKIEEHYLKFARVALKRFGDSVPNRMPPTTTRRVRQFGDGSSFAEKSEIDRCAFAMMDVAKEINSMPAVRECVEHLIENRIPAIPELADADGASVTNPSYDATLGSR